MRSRTNKRVAVIVISGAAASNTLGTYDSSQTPAGATAGMTGSAAEMAEEGEMGTAKERSADACERFPDWPGTDGYPKIRRNPQVPGTKSEPA